MLALEIKIELISSITIAKNFNRHIRKCPRIQTMHMQLSI